LELRCPIYGTYDELIAYSINYISINFKVTEEMAEEEHPFDIDQ